MESLRKFEAEVNKAQDETREVIRKANADIEKSFEKILENIRVLKIKIQNRK